MVRPSWVFFSIMIKKHLPYLLNKDPRPVFGSHDVAGRGRAPFTPK